MLGPLTCYDGPHTMRKIPGTEGAAVGPSLLRTMYKASDSQLSSIPKVPKATTRGQIFSLKFTKQRLAAGLRPDPLGELKCSRRPHSCNNGAYI